MKELFMNTKLIYPRNKKVRKRNKFPNQSIAALKRPLRMIKRKIARQNNQIWHLKSEKIKTSKEKLKNQKNANMLIRHKFKLKGCQPKIKSTVQQLQPLLRIFYQSKQKQSRLFVVLLTHRT